MTALSLSLFLSNFHGHATRHVVAMVTDCCRELDIQQLLLLVYALPSG